MKQMTARKCDILFVEGVTAYAGVLTSISYAHKHFSDRHGKESGFTKYDAGRGGRKDNRSQM